MKIFCYTFLIIAALAFQKVQAKQTINWLRWEQSSFEQAKKKHKMVFLDVGTEWCTACNWMESGTYTDSTVINILNNNFVCIKVDAEAQPDIGNRYLEWGWPALIFMDQNGNQVLALQGNRRPWNFIPILNSLIEQFNKGQLKPQIESESTSNASPDTSLSAILNITNRQLDNNFDTEFGGWGEEKIPLYSPVEYALWRAAIHHDKQQEAFALQTLKQTAKITDRVWGGVYFGAHDRNWDEGMPEKRTEAQAGTLQNFSQAYLATKDEHWKNEALLIKKYLMTFMKSPTSGLFYNSQEEYVSPEGNPQELSSLQYFALDDAHRRKLGVPPIDKTVYTDINARVINAFIWLYRATGDDADLQTAIQTTQKLIKTSYGTSGYYKQVTGNENPVSHRMREIPQTNIMYLRAQVYFGKALINLYGVTGDPQWLDKAKKLAKIMQEELYDTKNGGFYASNDKPVILAGKEIREKPFNDNALAASFLVDLYAYTDNEQWKKIAKKTIMAISNRKTIENEGRLVAEYAMAVDKLITGSVHFSVVTKEKNTTDAQKLFTAAQQIYYPAKVVRFEIPGHYPDAGKAIVYICDDKRCSPAISTLEQLQQEAEKLTK